MRGCVHGILLIGVLGILILPKVVAANDFKIIPGERIGDVTTQMSIDDILKLLGTPSNIERVSGFNVYHWQNRSLRVIQSSTTGEPLQVRTYYIYRNPNPYRTDKGVGIGASENQVMQAYGSAGCFRRFEEGGKRLYWPDLGIFFIVNTSPSAPSEIQNRVFEIGVQRAFFGQVSFGPCVEGSTRPSVPLPDNVRIIRPGPGVPSELAAFVGKWFGQWDGVRDHILIVEEVTLNPPQARVIFAVAPGTIPQQQRYYMRLQGIFVDGALQIRFPNGATVNYRVRSEDMLDATFNYAEGGTSSATMKRMND